MLYLNSLVRHSSDVHQLKCHYTNILAHTTIQFTKYKGIVTCTQGLWWLKYCFMEIK